MSAFCDNFPNESEGVRLYEHSRHDEDIERKQNISMFHEANVC